MTSNPSPVPITGGADFDEWLVRAWTDDASLAGASANYALAAHSGLSAGSKAEVTTDHPASQIEISGGLVTIPAGPMFATASGPHSVRAAGKTMSGVSLDVVFEADLTATLPFVQHRFSFAIT